MELYITLSDFAKDMESYINRVKNEDERIVIQNGEGETVAVLVPSKVIDVIERMTKSMKVNVVTE